MLLFSLSLSLQFLIEYQQNLIVLLSFYLTSNRNLIDYKHRIILFIILTNLFGLTFMFYTTNFSPSSKSTFEFSTSSIETIDSEEKLHSTKSIICFNESNFNRNANDIDENLKNERRFVHRSFRSSTDITTNELYSSMNHENDDRGNEPTRIESALMPNDDYTHCLAHSIVYESRPITNINMNKELDLIQQNEVTNKNDSNSIKVKTSVVKDNNHCLTLEHVSVPNRRTIQLTSTQFMLISVGVCVFVVLLCLTTILFIF